MANSESSESGGVLYYYALGVRGFSNDYAARRERVKFNIHMAIQFLLGNIEVMHTYLLSSYLNKLTLSGASGFLSEKKKVFKKFYSYFSFYAREFFFFFFFFFFFLPAD